MILNGAAAINHHKRELNELNVFPVPDGDTGTNMSLTMGAGATALHDSSPGTIGNAADITAGALLRGARGNSGVILSLLFRGIARHLKGMDTADSFTLACAISDGVDSAYKAVMKPAEGTILTVSRVAAKAAMNVAERVSDIETVLERTLIVGYEALAETINQNPVLKRAGVVDAGGKGYLYIMEGMLKALKGEKLQSEPVITSAGAVKADFSSFEADEIKFAYCTEFIIDRKSDKDVSLFGRFLDQRGDSIVVVDDDEIIKIHVHTNEPGDVLTEALTYGPLLTVKVENMKEQHTGKVMEKEAAPSQPDTSTIEDDTTDDKNSLSDPEKTFGIVTVCAGEGMRNVFRELGVDNIILGGQTMNPSTEDILNQIEATPAETVFVLPNNKNIIMAAQQCIPLTTKQVIVIPSKTMPQGISAMITMDISATAAENAELMTAAIACVHTAQITYAARDSEYNGHSIKAGDYLALLEDVLLATGTDTNALVDDVAAALAAFSPEFITVFYGADVGEEAAESVLQRLTAAIPSAESSMIDGGQPVYYYLISAE